MTTVIKGTRLGREVELECLDERNESEVESHAEQQVVQPVQVIPPLPRRVTQVTQVRFHAFEISILSSARGNTLGVWRVEPLPCAVLSRLLNSTRGGVPREQKILEGHLPRVIYITKNTSIRTQYCFVCSTQHVVGKHRRKKAKQNR